MTPYELMYLMPVETTEDSAKKTLADLTALIKKSGKVEEGKEWAMKKPLAYPIKKNMVANFYLMTFTMPSTNLAELKKKLDANSEIIRYLITKKN